MVVAMLAAALTPGTSVTVDEALLAGLPPVEANITVHGKALACSGPTLLSLLARLGLPQGENLRGAALSQVVVVRARDGYEVAFSLGELDLTLGAQPAIVATRCNGAALEAGDGPFRLILPADKRPARSVRMVTGISLK